MLCSRCIYSTSIPGISFDSTGVCNYCHQIEQLINRYGTGQWSGQKRWEDIASQIREFAKNREYGCVVGVSGGTDSSFLVALAAEQGLKPLAVHYDNTWNSSVATLNISRLLDQLSVDLQTFVLDNHVADDLFKSFFKAGVAELEATTDLGYAFLLRLVSAKREIPFILEGHSFVAEGVTPLRINYFDGRYIRSIHSQFGSIDMKPYPLMTLSRFLWSAAVKRPHFIRPLWFLDYSKPEAREMLQSRYGWSYYGGHHLENQMTAFYHSIYLPQKFGVDLRVNSLAAEVRSGLTDRDEALTLLKQPAENVDFLKRLFCRRLGIEEDEFEAQMAAPPRHWSEFKTYKRQFEVMRPLFEILVNKGLVPESFYIKYCFKTAGN